MKRTTALLILTAIGLASCNDEFGSLNAPMAIGSSSQATVRATCFENESTTRAVLNPAPQITFSWEQSDQLAIYAAGAGQSGLTNFDIKTIDQVDPTHAIFQASGFNLKGGNTYYAFYPYNPSATNKSRIPVSYGQTIQEADGAYSHLGAVDYQYASATAEGSTDAANIQFGLHHLGAICRFRISALPTGIQFSRFSITCDGIVTEGYVNLTGLVPVITPTQNSTPTQNVTLGNQGGSGFTTTSGTLTFYTMMAPVSLSGKHMALRLYSDKSDMCICEVTVNGKDMAAGKAYGYSATCSAPPTPTETDEWVDLGLTREDGSPLLFGAHNLGYTQGNVVGSQLAWTVADPVPALRGADWRTPSIGELRILFGRQAANYPLTWEKANDDSGIWVINTSMEAADGEGTHRLFLPFTNGLQGRYWSSTASNSYWPAVMALQNGELEASREYAQYYGTEVLSDERISNVAGLDRTTRTLAIRPIYVGLSK